MPLSNFFENVARGGESNRQLRAHTKSSVTDGPVRSIRSYMHPPFMVLKHHSQQRRAKAKLRIRFNFTGRGSTQKPEVVLATRFNCHKSEIMKPCVSAKLNAKSCVVLYHKWKLSLSSNSRQSHHHQTQELELQLNFLRTTFLLYFFSA